MYPYAILWLVTTIFSLALHTISQNLGAKQTAIVTGPPIAMLGWKAIAGPIIFGVVVMCLAFAMPAPYNQVFAGALALSQLAGFASSVGAILFQTALTRPGLAVGHLEYSSEMRYRVLSAELLSFVIVYLGLFAALHLFACGGAALIMGSTSLGYLRRARQAAQITRA